LVRTGALGVAAASVLTVLSLNAAVVEVRRIPSDSMSPTLQAGERVVVRKIGIDRDDLPLGALVVFDAADLWVPGDDPAGTVFVKRVVGLGGDRISCCDAAGRLLRNGAELPEFRGVTEPSDQERFDIVVMPHHYWLVGDNRGESADSRAHLGDPGGGNVPASRIMGTVTAVVWPPGSLRTVGGSDD
jgi:signal peptidase I